MTVINILVTTGLLHSYVRRTVLSRGEFGESGSEWRMSELEWILLCRPIPKMQCGDDSLSRCPNALKQFKYDELFFNKPQEKF